VNYFCVHAVVADGLFTESGCFHVMPKVDLRPLAELFRASMLKMLQKEGRIDDAFIRMIMAWQHNSGFSREHRGYESDHYRKWFQNEKSAAADVAGVYQENLGD